ncbi:MAG: TIGR03545 family protein [Gammaproteobacteria bacterium]|nr:TIGR03545 family protein [Gammaproteobacteria bacterium]
MKIIRWPGFIAFTVLLVIILGGSWIFSESIAKSIIESTLTDLNGAKVDVESVDINYSPFSIRINDLQITDPDRPMINTIQINQAVFSISFSHLLLKKIIIDDMALRGIQTDTRRAQSGAISKKIITKPGKQPGEDSTYDFAMPEIRLPDIDDLISKEQLNSEKLIAELEKDLDSTQQKWQEIRNDIQDKNRWDSYQLRYNKIQTGLSGNTAEKISALKNIKILRDDLKKEATKIQQARKQFNEDNNRLSDEFKALKNAPGDDIRRIKEKYKLNDLSTQNITQLLFGAQAAEYIALADKWYARIKPYIEDDPEEIAEQQAKQRKQGQNIKFREFNPVPDFYVRRASIDAQLPRGEFTGSIIEISSDQSINRKPMIMELSGRNLKHREGETLRAEFNYIVKDKGYSQIDYTIKAYQLENFDISKSNKLSLTMQNALMSLNLNLKLVNKRLSGNSNIDFKQVQFETNKNSTGQSFSSMMATSFSNIKKFRLDTSFSGSLNDLDINMKSDLDNQLGDQLKNQFRKKGQDFENNLRARIDDKLKSPMQKLDSKSQMLDQIKHDVETKEKELSQKLTDIENKLKADSKSKTDKKKDELLNKLKLKFK